MRAAGWVLCVLGAAMLGWSLVDFSPAGWAIWIGGAALLGAGLGLERVTRKR